MRPNYTPIPNSIPIVSPEKANTMPILVASALKSDSAIHIKECIHKAWRSHTRIKRPDGYCYWNGFLKAACDHSPEKLELMAQIMTELFDNLFWNYLDCEEFSFEIAGSLIRTMDEDRIEELREIHEAYNSTVKGKEVKYRRLTLLLYPEV